MNKTIATVNNPERLELRRKLRSAQTEFEKLLWNKLRNCALGFRCKRQVSIGCYVVDFCFLSTKLVVELDGVQHEDNLEYDANRTKDLTDLGFRVLRFWNSDLIQDMDGVLNRIFRELHKE